MKNLVVAASFAVFALSPASAKRTGVKSQLEHRHPIVKRVTRWARSAYEQSFFLIFVQLALDPAVDDADNLVFDTVIAVGGE
jgi:hypothetical protein